MFLIELESLFKLDFIISSKNITELLFGLVKNSSLFFLGLIVVVEEEIVEIWLFNNADCFVSSGLACCSLVVIVDFICWVVLAFNKWGNIALLI